VSARRIGERERIGQRTHRVTGAPFVVRIAGDVHRAQQAVGAQDRHADHRGSQRRSQPGGDRCGGLGDRAGRGQCHGQLVQHPALRGQPLAGHHRREPLPEIGYQRQIGIVGPAVGVARDQGQQPDHRTIGEQRHDQDASGAQRCEGAVLRLVAGGGDAQQFLVDPRHDERLPGPVGLLQRRRRG
jgi:hypothetical protein